MLESYCKTWYQKYFLDSLLAYPVTHKLSPNFITLLSLLTGISILPALYFNHTIIATLFLLLSGYFDTLDGALARMGERSSPLGTVFDIMSDRMVECSIVLALFSIDPAGRGVWALCMLCSMLICITSFLVVGIFAQNQSAKSFHYSPGLMERAEAFIFFAMMIWLPAHFISLAVLFSLLVLWTGWNRIKEFTLDQKELCQNNIEDVTDDAASNSHL